MNPTSDVRVHAADDRGWTGAAWTWRWPSPVRVASTALFGGGIGHRRWVANLTVGRDYSTPDPSDHAAEVAEYLGRPAEGVVLMTAFDVRRSLCMRNEGVHIQGSVAIGVVCWAAGADASATLWRPGTVNLVIWVPEPLCDAALLNVMTTVAEAKAQAFVEAGIPGTSTPSDAVAVACPVAEGTAVGADGRYGGPRSHWGSRVARGVRRFVLDGITADGAVHGVGDDGSWEPA